LVGSIKAGRERLRRARYKVVEAGINLLAIHKTPVVTKLQIPELPAQSSAT